jgi:hypothetical protein
MGNGGLGHQELLNAGRRTLARAKSLRQIEQIRHKAQAVWKVGRQVYLRLEVINRATELKLSAERCAGDLLTQRSLREGDRWAAKLSDCFKLRDLGLSQNQSTQWQAQVRIPEDVVREFIRPASQRGIELGAARLLRLARNLGKLPADEPSLQLSIQPSRDERRSLHGVVPTAEVHGMLFLPDRSN